MHSEHNNRIGNTKPNHPIASDGDNTIQSNPKDLSNYSLTIGEASFLMDQERCKFASNRKVQRMCKEGRIDCWKLSTTRNGQPVSEWLVNETSLRKHIEKNEIKWDGDHDYSPADRSMNFGNASAVPDGFGNARQKRFEPNEPVVKPDAMAVPDRNGNASDDRNGGGKLVKTQANSGDAMAMPDTDGDAKGKSAREQIGETRSLASLLIENARLTAELEGKRELETEMRDEKLFLREELKEARAGRKDVAAIAERMLQTLETIAIGGKLIPGSRPSGHTQQNSDFPSRTIVRRNAEVAADVEAGDISGSEVTDAESLDRDQSEPNASAVQNSHDPENPFYI
jgi:hypothetical protein